MGRIGDGRRWAQHHPTAVSIVEGVVIVATGVLSLLLQIRADELTGQPDTIPRWLAVTWTVVLLAPFAAHRRNPLATVLVVGIVFTGYRWWLVPEYTVSAIAMFLVVVFAGRDGAPRRNAARGIVVAVIAAMFVASLITQDVPAEYRPIFRWNLAFVTAYNAFFFAAAWLLGDALRRRHEREHELEERTAQLEAERELNAQRAVVDERLRIARDLHDVVAHHVSVMGVQAGAARRVLARAADALSTVESSSRDAVDELRRLDRLVDDTRATGLDVRLVVGGAPRIVPESIGLSVYRVVQEALTNKIKHAHARTVHVRIGFRSDAVQVVVLDDGVGLAPPGTNGQRHGIAGMRERVALHGGALDARPARGRGGFLVRARFPLRGSS